MDNLSALKAGTVLNDKFFQPVIMLDSWKGFQSRQGPYNSSDAGQPSNGRVKLLLEGEEQGNQIVISQAQVNAVEYVMANAAQIRDLMLNAFWEKYPEWQEFYGEDIPDLKSADDFKKYLGLSIVHILPSAQDGMAYIGYEFGCDWEEEHGIGVMTFRDKILEIGMADTAFDIWVTYKDNGEDGPTDNDIIPDKNFRDESKNDSPDKPWWKLW